MQFKFNENYVLENEHVLLRPLVPEDLTHLIDFSVKEPEIWKYSLVPAAGTEAMKQYIQAATEARKKEREYAYIVFDKRSNEYAGSTRFYDIQLANKTLQLGYTWYGKKFQGSGLNKHCKFLLLTFAFEIMNMERVEFRADHENKKSIAAMMSIGCTKEGVIRSSSFRQDGTRRDSILLSILKQEWLDEKRHLLKNKLTTA
ncbi:MAG: GNAT family N-acetyltransferase [Chitinophagaceae bacterium]|nr:GNAT family N-acetyltransferase [Chitinophagaceae bacterium]